MLQLCFCSSSDSICCWFLFFFDKFSHRSFLKAADETRHKQQQTCSSADEAGSSLSLCNETLLTLCAHFSHYHLKFIFWPKRFFNTVLCASPSLLLLLVTCVLESTTRDSSVSVLFLQVSLICFNELEINQIQSMKLFSSLLHLPASAAAVFTYFGLYFISGESHHPIFEALFWLSAHFVILDINKC